MKKSLAVFVLLISLSIVHLSAQTPKNIIFIIGNGMGYNHAKISEGSIADFPVKLGVSTYPAMTEKMTSKKKIDFFDTGYESSRAWGEHSYIDSSKTDYASSGSAIATGLKTAYRAMGYFVDSTELETIFERAHNLGKKTGIISSGPVSKSSVAAFLAHEYDADNIKEVASDILLSKANLVIGSGNPYFDANAQETNAPSDFSTIVNQATYKALENNSTELNNAEVADIDGDDLPDAWNFITSNADLLSFSNSDSKRIFGLAQVEGDLQYYRTNAEKNDIPSLGRLCTEGLNYLKNDNGFIAAIEHSAIAYASRDNNAERLIEEMTEFHKTVDSVIAWVELNGGWEQNLVVVLGNYEAGFVSSPEADVKNAYFYNNFDITGNTANDFVFNSTVNTNSLTPLFSKGEGCNIFQNYIDETDYFRRAYINNTEIAQAVCNLWPYEQEVVQEPKNIILMISDGCGINQVKAADYYTGQTQAYENFPVKYFMSTYPARTSDSDGLFDYNNSYTPFEAWTNYDYFLERNNTTCSAASATAMANGRKTYYYCLGVDLDFNSVYNISNYAHDKGKLTAVTTTVPFNNATPACFTTHNISRDNGEEIARSMLIESNHTVIMGCGHPFYDNRANELTTPDYEHVGGEKIWEGLVNNASSFEAKSNSMWNEVRDIDNDDTLDPWNMINDSADFVKYMTGKTPKRVLGIPKVDYTLQHDRKTNSQIVDSSTYNKNMPNLRQMSVATLNILQNNQTNGFFAMLEGGAIDQAGHAMALGSVIEEQIDFNNAVDGVIEWIENNGGWEENLLIVTADHETGYLTGPRFSSSTNMIDNFPIIDKGKGNMPGMKFNNDDHTNQLVPFYAKGKGAEHFHFYADEYDPIRGRFLNNSEIGQGLFKQWHGTPCKIYNMKPIQITPIERITAVKGEDFVYKIPTENFSDREDGQNVHFRLLSASRWLSLDEETQSLVGIPNKEGNVTAEIGVYDGISTGAATYILTRIKIQIVDNTIENIDNDSDEIAIGPNPAHNIVVVTLPNHYNGTYELHSLSGSKTLEGTVTEGHANVDVSNLSKGTYTLTIECGYVSFKQKIVIN